jgi:phosphate-selective porin OprO/OprP
LRTLPLLPLAAIMFPSIPAQAQDREVDELRAQVAQLTAQLEVLSARLDDLESEEAQVAAASPAAASVVPPVIPSVTAGSETRISLGAAPEVENAQGFSFKPFGRLMIDAGATSLPGSIAAEDGFGQEIRRARLGVEGAVPGGFGYKMEVDFAGNEVEITDAILTYEAGNVDLTVGQHNAFQSLEELTSSRFTSFIERAAFTDAFGFERRLGISAQYGAGDVLVQGGVFTANIDDLPNDSWGVDGRAVYSPRLGNTQLHLGGSLHYRDLEGASAVRYRQRPLVHFTSTRLIDTGSIGARSEFGAGVEFAAIRGPLHLAAEGYRQEVGRTAGLGDVTFHGGYVEAGLFLTPGDSRGYRGARFNRTRPARAVGDGGIGAVQVNLRYDYLDLNAGPITGGTQNGLFASLIWTTTAFTRFQINYGRLEYDDAAIALASGERDYSADTIGVRAEFDF